MQVKILFESQYKIVAVMDRDECPAEQFLLQGDDDTEGARNGLVQMLGYLAEHGLGAGSHAWMHEASKAEQIYEFIKGPLRLFFFKGNDGHIAVCTGGVRKKGQKADKQAVKQAAALRGQYQAAFTAHTLEIIESEEDQQGP